MTNQNIYKISEAQDQVFWSDGKERRGPYYGNKLDFISLLRDSRKDYSDLSDFKDTCVLLIPKEFC
jgi:hypothetical protein